MQSLTEEQKRRFVWDGFLHVPGVVPPRVVTRARRAINHALGAGIDPDERVRLDNQTFSPELTGDPRLLRLAIAPAVWSHVRALLGDRRAVRPRDCQIASVRGLENHRVESMLDIWRDWPALRGLVGPAACGEQQWHGSSRTVSAPPDAGSGKASGNGPAPQRAIGRLRNRRSDAMAVGIWTLPPERRPG